MSINGLKPEGITAEFVEFYLAEAGLDPDDYHTEQLADVWRETEEVGDNILLWYAVFRHRKDEADNKRSLDWARVKWPHPAGVQRKFYEKEGVATTP